MFVRSYYLPSRGLATGRIADKHRWEQGLTFPKGRANIRTNKTSGISNRKALKLLNSEAYLDLKTGKIYYDSEWLKERFRYLILKAEAEVKAEAKISLPSTDQGLKNLMALAKRYGDLLQKSTGFSGLRVTEDGLIFEGMDAENEAHNMLLDYMKKFAEASKGIKEKEALHAENEKFTFRTWLLRMGWKGRETSELRTSLYKGLSGNSAFCTEGSKERWMEKHGRASTPRQ